MTHLSTPVGIAATFQV